MSAITETAGMIINSEFGNEPSGRSIIKKFKFWPSLLKRTSELCENAYNKGKRDCRASDHVIVPEADIKLLAELQSVIQVWNTEMPVDGETSFQILYNIKEEVSKRLRVKNISGADELRSQAEVDRLERKKEKEEDEEYLSGDNWTHCADNMKCQTCMWYVPKGEGKLGRCRHNAPTLKGWPAMFPTDWCGCHKLDENKL